VKITNSNIYHKIKSINVLYKIVLSISDDCYLVDGLFIENDTTRTRKVRDNTFILLSLDTYEQI
jgi:hypothetical protein